jgi:general secretion pathway protein G
MKSARGFTLVEMIAVVAIVGILVAAGRPIIELSARRAREAELRHDLRQLREAIDAYKRASDEGRIAHPADASGYPPSLEALAEGVPDARMPGGSRRIYFLRRIPRDPFATDASLTAAQTWALRSHDSPPDSPRPGRDVFDVASRSERRAIDGTLYSQW